MAVQSPYQSYGGEQITGHGSPAHIQIVAVGVGTRFAVTTNQDVVVARLGEGNDRRLVGLQRVLVAGVVVEAVGNVAVADEDLVGSVVVGRDGNTASFGMLAVAPTRQGAGTGRRVLQDVEDWVSIHWKSRRMRMKVIAQRAELIAWYERRGYRLTGESEPFYYGDERFGLPKRPDLKFAVMEKDLSGTRTG